MDKIEKLFRKITKKERMMLSQVLAKLIANETAGLNIKKIQSSEYYRLRIGSFRIIFHTVGSGVIIDDIRLKNKSTYKNL
jgi:mRNA-degrading endonuclease RelE of RelBE toxin-antitoxin system